MKYLIVTILTSITINCCAAIDKNISSSANEYIVTKEKLEQIYYTTKTEQKSLEYWSKNLNKEQNKNHVLKSADMVAFYQEHVDKTQNRINDLKAQYVQTQESLKNLESIKQEYDRQVEKELKLEEFKTAVLNITGMYIFPLAIFVLGGWIIIRHNLKYWRLLKAGKITQQQYNEVTQSSSSYTSSNMGVNPATGLPMSGIGISDISGLPRGASPITSCSSYTPEYRSKLDW